MAYLWKQLGSPLRPVDEDLEPVRAALRDWCAANSDRAPRGLILGVTPELYRLPWPDRSRVTAVDRTPDMIEQVWPGDPAHVLRADWRMLPLPAESVDIAICDGGLHLLDYPSGQHTLMQRLERVIAPGGLLILRLFAPPATAEPVGAVLADLFSGAVVDLNCLKLRLGMALQPTPEAGVALDEVWRTLHDAAGDWAQLAQRLGWELDHLLAIDAYRNSPARYHFVSVAAALELAAGAFETMQIQVPDYPLGERCPTLVLRRTDPGSSCPNP